MSTLEKKSTILRHGAYSATSQFQIIQHKYAGCDTGFIELLEVLDPPFGYERFYIYCCNSDFPSSLTVFNSLENAIQAWDIFFSVDSRYVGRTLQERFSWRFQRLLCIDRIPWFYVFGDLMISGYFAVQAPEEQQLIF